MRRFYWLAALCVGWVGCSEPRCGDSIVDSSLGEECDDGNTLNGDFCQAACLLPRCGDGFTDEILREKCDDGNTDDRDACPTNCEPAFCGDGFVQRDIEECDDRNTNDDDGCSSACQIIQPTNRNPVAVNDTATASEDLSLTIPIASLLANDTDEDGDTLALNSVSNAINAFVLLSGDNVVVTPDENFNGTALFQYTVRDGNGGSDTGFVTVAVNAVNDPPRATNDEFSANEDVPVTLTANQLLSNDSDVDGEPLTLASVGNAQNGTVALSGGSVVFTPSPNFSGTASFQYTVQDSNGGTDTGTVTLSFAPVNDPPSVADGVFFVDEDQVLVVTAQDLLQNATDVDSASLLVLSVGDTVNGNVTFSDGVVRFSPAANFFGDASFTYLVFDGNQIALGLVSVLVEPVNDAPLAQNDAQSTSEDAALTVPAASILANDADIDGGALSIAAVGGATNGTVALSGSDVVFTPNANFNGAASFQYTVSDGNGGTDGGLVSIAVSAVNDAPVAVDDTRTTNEDSALTISKSSLLANDLNVDGDSLDVTAVSAAVNGTVALSGNNVVFTPAANFNGAASFQYTVSDGSLSDTGLVAVAVTPVNDAPVAVSDALNTNEDTPATVSASVLLANDSDADGNALSVVSVSNGAGGVASLAGGIVTFTPNANFNGAANFSYTISDGTVTASAQVAVTVVAVADAPIATDDTRTTNEDTALTVSQSSLLTNDTDADGNTLSLTAVSAAVNGTVAISGSNVVFTPNANFNGTASFQYTVSDGTLTDTGLVAVTVTAVNDAPVAVDDTRTTAEDTALIVSAASLLANDTDIEGNTLNVTAVSAAVNGAVSLSGGNVTFTPTANFNGSASFQYTANDGNGGTDIGLVVVTVTAVNDAPVAVNDTRTTAEDTTLTVTAASLLTNDTDADGNTLSVTAVSAAVNGTVALSGSNVVFTPNANFNGSASFQYTVSDGSLSATGLVTVTVTAVNDAPIADAKNIIAVANSGAKLITLTGSDVDGNTLSFSIATGPTRGTLGSISPTGATSATVIHTPGAGQDGSDSFTVRVSDGSLFSAPAQITITIGSTQICGNNAVEAGEACDDGNANNNDNCLSTCALNLCGDGILNPIEEACDDGNNANGDSCNADCSQFPIVQIVTGFEHTCALLETGNVRCWGEASKGQLGYGNTNRIGDNETHLAAGDVNVGGVVVQIAAGTSHTCALLDTGNVRCWGSNDLGQLGYGNFTNIGDNETPASAGNVNVGGTVVQITAGNAHTCALLNTGNVRCWGTGGQLGYGNGNIVSDPSTVGNVNIGGTVIQIDAGAEHTCALLSTGNVRCWGLGSGGRLGYGNTNFIGDNETPASAGDVNVGGTVVQISAGGLHTCAVLNTGKVRCWGGNFDGELGYGNTNFFIAGGAAGDVNVGGSVVQISTGALHTCAVLNTGAGRCWGEASSGQLGYGNTNDIGDNETPALIGNVIF